MTIYIIKLKFNSHYNHDPLNIYYTAEWYPSPQPLSHFLISRPNLEYFSGNFDEIIEYRMISLSIYSLDE